MNERNRSFQKDSIVYIYIYIDKLYYSKPMYYS